MAKSPWAGAGGNIYNVFASDTSGLQIKTTYNVYWNPTSVATGIVAAFIGNTDYISNTADVTSGGHAVGVFGRVRNLGSRSLGLAVGAEGVIENNGAGTIALAYCIAAHASIAAGSFGVVAGFSDLFDASAGTTFAYSAMLLNDFSAIIPGAYRYGVDQRDNTAWNMFRGKIYGSQQARKGGIPVMPEVSPPLHPGFVSARYYTTPAAGALGPVPMTANQIYCCPFFVSEETTFTEIGCRVTTGVAGNLRMAIYQAWAGKPQVLVTGSDVAAISSAVAGTKTQAISVTLAPGWYYLAVVASATPTINFVQDLTTSANGMTTDNGGETTLLATYAFAAFPTNFPAVSYTNAGGYVPHIWLRK